MGIYDRDYIRSQPPAGGGVGRGGVVSPRMWSVNTWLIVVCVAVFVVDGFLPPRWVQMQTSVLVDRDQFDAIDGSRLVEDPQIVITRNQRTRSGRVMGVAGYRPVSVETPQGRLVVARNEYVRMQFLASFLHFSTARALIHSSPTSGLTGFEFWRFIGFQFLHGGQMHLLFNMVGLFFFGGMVERYLGGKRYLAFYLLCGMFGALMYMLLNTAGYIATMFLGPQAMIPGLLFNSPATPLVGASAGVYGVIMAGAFLAPQARVLLFFVIPMRLSTLAYLIVGMALFTMLTGGNNAGGEAGHVGGALAGFYFIRHPHRLHGFFDILGRLDPTSRHFRGRVPGAVPGVARAEIDRILDKISAEGIQGLTDREKRILREASRR